jgi:hypothetical protein
VDNSLSVTWRGVLLGVRIMRESRGIEQFDAARQGLTNIEASGALAVVPIEGVPTGTVAGSCRWAAAAARFAAADELLAVDDAIRSASPSAEIGASRFRQEHADSLHKQQHGKVASSGRLVDGCWSHMAMGSVRRDDWSGGVNVSCGARQFQITATSGGGGRRDVQLPVNAATFDSP